jgi:hypothetical protein
MNRFVCLLFLTLATGCAISQPPASPEPSGTPTGPAPAHVTRVNPEFRFVVIDFSARDLPAVGTILNLYRADQRVGSVRITEPVRSHFATADIVEGDAQVGDEVR